MAVEVLSSVNPIGQLVDKPALRGSTPHLLHAAVVDAHTPGRAEAAWRPLMVPEEDLAKVLEEADEEHSKGNLFPKEGGGVDEAAEEEKAEEDSEGEEAQEEEDDYLPAWEEEEAPASLPPGEALEAPASMPPGEALEAPASMPPGEAPEAPASMPPGEALAQPPKRGNAMCRFLALRLVYGTASAAEVLRAASGASSSSHSTSLK